jgi:hypothetical protein
MRRINQQRVRIRRAAIYFVAVMMSSIFLKRCGSTSIMRASASAFFSQPARISASLIESKSAICAKPRAFQIDPVALAVIVAGVTDSRFVRCWCRRIRCSANQPLVRAAPRCEDRVQWPPAFGHDASADDAPNLVRLCVHR